MPSAARVVLTVTSHPVFATVRLAFCGKLETHVVLRLSVGFFLLLCAAGLSFQAAAQGRSLLDDSRSLLEQLSQPPREPTEQENERIKEEVHRFEENQKRLEEQFLNNEARARQMLDDKRTLLAGQGPAFEFAYYSTPMAGPYFVSGCLIGEPGKVYTYDAARDDPGVPMVNQVNEREYKIAVNLATTLDHEPLRSRSGGGGDIGYALWTVTFSGTTTILKVDGNDRGVLSDPRATELVKLIGDWCPLAERFDRLGVWGAIQSP
jgi:hypothetical protein